MTQILDKDGKAIDPAYIAEIERKAVEDHPRTQIEYFVSRERAIPVLYRIVPVGWEEAV